ncbi:MAG: OmpA family protein [Geminicoccaceae bacterium]
MRFFGIILCLIALGLTTYSALTYMAPRIEADIEARTSRAVATVAGDDIDIRVDGRHVTLSGTVADDRQRLQVLSMAATVPGALGPTDALQQMASTAPYRFEVVKDQDGRVTIAGMAPDQEAKESIAAESRALFGDAVAVDIEIAEGAPSEDWQRAAISSLDALATLRQGRLAITDSDIVLEGDVAADADVEAIDMFAETMPQGFTWTHDVGTPRERVDPFTFSVVKDPEGGLRLSGFAPDEETRATLIEQGKAVSGSIPMIADIRVADGMPDEEWPSLVIAGISAMKDVDTGRYDVVGNDVSFASDDETAVDGSAPEAAPPPGQDQQTAQLAVTGNDDTVDDSADGPVDAALTQEAGEPQRQTPELTIDKVDEGTWSMRGVVPDQQARDRLAALIQKQADVGDVEIELALAGSATDEGWLQFAADHIATLDKVSAGRLTLDDYDAHLIGVVETPEDIEPVQAAIAAIDQTMTVDLQPIDPRPIAAIDLALAPNAEIVLEGTLPEGLTEGEALLALGLRQHEGRLDANGRGPVEAWRRDLSEIGALLPAFERVDLSLGDEGPKVRGLLHAHADADAIADQLVLALGADKEPLVEVETTTTVHEEGAKRTSPITGNEEVYRRGFWIPVIEIAGDKNVCSERSTAMQATDKITFGRGQEDLDHRSLAILNDLAGLASACLGQTDLVLEIGGHTDSRGAAQMNRDLSQARANAVLDALAARGVDTGSLIAIGYGDEQPIADNATNEGRAANRRITFEWKTSAEGQG